MPWQIGIDEAGYGPNLGPFVMTLVACRLPDTDADLWQLLHPAVRRADDAVDARLIVADSKQVYAPARGWGDLEKTALASFSSLPNLQALLEQLAPDELCHLRKEAWFVGDTGLPTEVPAEEHASGMCPMEAREPRRRGSRGDFAASVIGGWRRASTI